MTYILIILLIFNFLLVWNSIRNSSINKKIKKRLSRVDDDINTLHSNQNVLVSTLSQLRKELNSNERQFKKESKIFKRRVKLASEKRESDPSDAD